MSLDGDALESAAAAAYEVSRGRVLANSPDTGLDELPPWEKARDPMRAPWLLAARAAIDAYAAHVALFGRPS